MAASFQFELVSPERVLIPEQSKDPKEKTPPADALEVLVPGVEGDFTVLPGHTPVIAALRPGVIDIRLAGGAKRRVFVRGGIADVDPEHLTILAPSALDLDGLDRDRLATERKGAEADLAAAADDEARRLAGLAVEELARIAG